MTSGERSLIAIVKICCYDNWEFTIFILHKYKQSKEFGQGAQIFLLLKGFYFFLFTV